MAIVETIKKIGEIADAVGVTAEQIGAAATKIEQAANSVYNVLDTDIGVTIQVANLTPWRLQFLGGSDAFAHGGWASNGELGFDVFPDPFIEPGDMMGCCAEDKGF
jgi:hypothetical protein